MATWQTVCKQEEIEPGKIKIFNVGEHRIALCRVNENEFYAVQDLCTHDDGPLGEGELLDYSIECPRHGARFDVKTGKVQALPAVVPIQTFPTKIVGDSIQVEA